MFTPATHRSSNRRPSGSRPASLGCRALALSSLVTAATILAGARAAEAAVIFVRASQTLATPLQTGASWATAFKDLQNGLAAASTGDEIWISQGTYKPTSGTDRTVSFVLKNGVNLIGGFAGNETLLSQRDILVHRTILSGEIGGATTADNSFHVVRASSLSSLTIVDGVTIQDGNANGLPTQSETVASAVFSTSSSVTLSSCVIRNNKATSQAAILSNSGFADRRVILFQCLIAGNQTGPAVSIQGIGGGTISQCTIANNAGGVVFVGATVRDACDAIRRRAGHDSKCLRQHEFPRQCLQQRGHVPRAGQQFDLWHRGGCGLRCTRCRRYRHLQHGVRL